MNDWPRLTGPSIRGKEIFWRLPFAEGGGRLWLLLPAVAQPQAISLGIGSRSTVPPTQLYFRSARLELHSQVKYFDLPDDVEDLFLGVRFSGRVTTIAVSYLWIMGVITATRVDIPLVAAPDFKAPVDANYERFRFPRTNEVFVKHSDTQWRGELREDYKGFKSAVATDPLAELDDPDLQIAAELVASSQQGYWTGLRIQNDSSETKAVALRVITDEGTVVDELVTLTSGQAHPIVDAKLSSETGRVKVYAVSDSEVPLTMNIYYNYIIDVAPAAV